MKKILIYFCAIVLSILCVFIPTDFMRRLLRSFCARWVPVPYSSGNSKIGDVFKDDGVIYKRLTDSAVQVGDGENQAVPYQNTSCTIPAMVKGDWVLCAVTRIGNRAFYKCQRLTSVTFPACVTSIGDRAFYDCDGLTSMTLPASLTSIGDDAFQSCFRLTSVTFPAALTSIGVKAFSGCNSLTSVTFPAALTHIGDLAFSSCSGLTSFVVAPENPSYCSVGGVLFSKDKTCLVAYPRQKKGSSYTIPTGVTSIGNDAFCDCERLTSVTLPAGVTRIGDRAFCECNGLTCVTLPASLTSIGSDAFRGCERLTCMTLPASLTNIGNDAFRGCERLTSVTLPASLTSLGVGAFDACNDLATFTVHPENPSYCSVDGILFNKDKTCLVAYPKGSLRTSYTVPDGVTRVGDFAFCACSGLSFIDNGCDCSSEGDSADETGLEIPDLLNPMSMRLNSSPKTGLDHPIGNDDDFDDDDDLLLLGDTEELLDDSETGNLYSLTLPASLTSIGKSAFKRCYSLMSVTLPASVTSVEEVAFQSCSHMISLTLPDALIRIGDKAFCGCCRLHRILYLGAKEPFIGHLTFDEGPGDRILSVPPNTMPRFDAAKWNVRSINHNVNRNIW